MTVLVARSALPSGAALSSSLAATCAWLMDGTGAILRTGVLALTGSFFLA
jgi:hypothetical protein